MEHTLVTTINASYTWCMMERLDVSLLNIRQIPYILNGCVFYGMVLMLILIVNVEGIQ